MIQAQIHLLIKADAAERRVATEMSPFLRRDYENHQEIFVSLTANFKTAVRINLSTIEFLMVQVVDESGAVIDIYRNLSPESWQFQNFFGSWDVQNCTSISLKSDIDARVHVIAGGEA